MTKKTLVIRDNSTADYKGERVKILEVIKENAYIWIPSRQEEAEVSIDKLKNIKPKPKEINYF